MRCVALLLAAWLAAGAAQAQDDPAELRQQVLVMLPIKSGPGQAQARRHLARQLAREHHLALEYRWAMPLAGVECFVLRLPHAQAAARVSERLLRDRRVAWAEPMGLYRGLAAAASHDDPLYAVQPSAWHLAELHRRATGRGIRIAVIDSAVEARHPDLAGQLAWRENFVDGRFPVAEQHGTAVAGLIAARADNGVGIAGVAPKARLMALRACWQAGEATRCSTLTLAKALQFAIENRAQVINLSLSGPAGRLLEALLDAALAQGIVVVGAFDGTHSDGGFPASHPGVLAVAGESGPPGVATAPGRDLPTTLPGAHWGFVSGASYAAAQVSGLMALLLEVGMTAPVAALVRGPADAVDACASVQSAAGDCACDCGAMAHR